MTTPRQQQSLVVRSMGGNVLAEVGAIRISMKSSPYEAWKKQALRAQTMIAREKNIPLCRVAIVATNEDGSEANAVISTAPPEFRLEEVSCNNRGGDVNPPHDSHEDPDSIIIALLAFLWEHVSTHRKPFHFSADEANNTNKLAIESFWWDGAVHLIVRVNGCCDNEWMATIKSDVLNNGSAEMYVGSREHIITTALALSSQEGLTGIVDTQTMRLRLV